jgi:L-arabinose isomerase
MTIDLRKHEVWFLTGSQHLYGAETLEPVERQAVRIVVTLADGSL